MFWFLWRITPYSLFIRLPWAVRRGFVNRAFADYIRLHPEDEERVMGDADLECSTECSIANGCFLDDEDDYRDGTAMYGNHKVI